MEPLVPITMGKNGYDYCFKIYIEGQGTFDRKSDSTLGYAMGAGDSGVVSRAKQGIRSALDMLDDFFKKRPPKDYFIEKVDVDVFGFSRGAATARYSIFLMTDILPSLDTRTPLHTRLRWAGYDEITAKNVEIKFAGLYDTVVSVKLSQYDYWSDNVLNQRAVAIATKSLHLAAAEEHRLDFPLHTIESAKRNGKGKEYYLPGAHSDVGGSYNLANAILANKVDETTSSVLSVLAVGSYQDMTTMHRELIEKGVYPSNRLLVDVTKLTYFGMPSEAKLVKLRTLKKKEFMRTSNEVNCVINEGEPKKLEADKARLIALGWYRENELKIDIKPNPRGATHAGNLVANRKNIKSAYSNIPLKIMARMARESGIEINPKLEDNAEIILSTEPDLLWLEKNIEHYIQAKGNNSKPDDWLDSPFVDIKNIRHDHLHMSAKVEIGYHPRIRDGKRQRYYYEG